MNNDTPDRDSTNARLAAEAREGESCRECPHCASVKTQRWGTARGMPRYRCSECKRTFNPLTGTSLARLRSRDKWFLFLRTVAQQKSIRKSAEICDIDNNTVLRWRRRFDACTAAEKRTIMMALMESGPSLLALQQQSINALPEWVVDLLPAILTWLG